MTNADTEIENAEVLDTDEVEIEVVDDTPPEDRVAERDVEASPDEDGELDDEGEIEQYSDRVQKRIKKLKS